MNATRKDFGPMVRKEKEVLVGFSSSSCARCAGPEGDYVQVAEALQTEGIKFIRVDVAKEVDIARRYGVVDVPALIFFKKKKPFRYEGAHLAGSIMEWVTKMRIEGGVTDLVGKVGVEEFWVQNGRNFITNSQDDSAKQLQQQEDQPFSASSYTVILLIGFFRSPESMEIDEYEDFLELAREMQPIGNVFVGAVKDEDVVAEMRSAGVIQRTPSVNIYRKKYNEAMTPVAALSNPSSTFYLDTDDDVQKWARDESVESMIFLTNARELKAMERKGLPIIMLFVEGEQSHSGGVLNENLFREFQYVADELRDKLGFVVAPGNIHSSQMVMLGLKEGGDNLPAIAVNSQHGLGAIFPNDSPMNRDTIKKFCAQVLSGGSSESIGKSLQAVSNKMYPITRSYKGNAFKFEKGIAERFTDGEEDFHIAKVTVDNFEAFVMDESKKVLLMIHTSKNCELCANFAVYYKHVGLRFHELGIDISVAELDLGDDEKWAEYLGARMRELDLGNLPRLVLFGRGPREPPFKYFSGFGKTKAIMDWTGKQLGLDLGDLAHLNDEDKARFKEQVTAREKARGDIL